MPNFSKVEQLLTDTHVETEPKKTDREDAKEGYRSEEFPPIKLDQKRNKYTCDLSIPVEFFRYIIGTGGETKKKLQLDTKCSIDIPR